MTKETAIPTYCLFAGRHAMPNGCKGAITSEFDFITHKSIQTPLWDELLYKGGKLIVTGLTPVLVEFLTMMC